MHSAALRSQRRAVALLCAAACFPSATSGQGDNGTQPSPPVVVQEGGDTFWLALIAVCLAGICLLGGILFGVHKLRSPPSKVRRVPPVHSLSTPLHRPPRSPSASIRRFPSHDSHHAERELASERHRVVELQRRIDALEKERDGQRDRGLSVSYNNPPPGILRQASQLYQPPPMQVVPDPQIVLSSPTEGAGRGYAASQTVPIGSGGVSRRSSDNVLPPLCETLGGSTTAGETRRQVTLWETPSTSRSDGSSRSIGKSASDPGSPPVSRNVPPVSGEAATHHSRKRGVPPGGVGVGSPVGGGGRSPSPSSSSSSCSSSSRHVGSPCGDSVVSTSFAESYHSDSPPRMAGRQVGLLPPPAAQQHHQQQQQSLARGAADALPATPGSSTWSPGHCSYPSLCLRHPSSQGLPVFEEVEEVQRVGGGGAAFARADLRESCSELCRTVEKDRVILKSQHELIEREKQQLQRRLSEMQEMLAAAGQPQQQQRGGAGRGAALPMTTPCDPGSPRPRQPPPPPASAGAGSVAWRRDPPSLSQCSSVGAAFYRDASPPLRLPSPTLAVHVPMYGWNAYGMPTPLE